MKFRIPLSTRVKAEKSDDPVLITLKPGKYEKLKQAVFMKHVANVENSLPLGAVHAESKSDF